LRPIASLLEFVREIKMGFAGYLNKKRYSHGFLLIEVKGTGKFRTPYPWEE
jgi:hypothetical protein